ncbi:unnamed protein product [Triticum turgidum subsp. durum]|uniref:Uncharacterized protein n=1 Tax=Triticum turgidum subsp. durum TaxID=4567 RepID=A0A9R0ZMP4_TRITD|nr:unnamed protein product [Triticum turgidum subsp. durum]
MLTILIERAKEAGQVGGLVPHLVDGATAPRIRTRRRWLGPVSTPSGAGHGPASKCVCAPATHAGSFKCRFHRINSQGHDQGHGQGSRPSSPPSLATANEVPRHPASPSSSSGTVATQ